MQKPDNKKTILYCRLSQEDLQAGESKSIQNQKLFLQKYANDNHFPNTEIIADDGWSGANFNRPGLNELIEEVKAGRVSTVIIKDQSRIGRDVLEIGLLKRTFEENNVRFIAVNDGFDTAKGFDIMSLFRDVINEWLVADTSAKIRAIKQSQAQRGKRVNGEAPYGYILDPEDKHHLIPDPETAHVVKQIFSMYVEGARICHIQDWLRDNQILTVGELRHRRTGKCRHPRPQLGLIYNWPDKTIYGFLDRKEYLGHTITGKTTKVSYKSSKTLRNPEEKQYIFYNTHEPLIDEATFELAQKRLATRNRPTKVNEIDIFSGLLFCADCNYKMYLQWGDSVLERNHSYTCGNYRNRARNNYSCSTHYIRRAVVMELVLADIQRVTKYVRENEREFIEKATMRNNTDAKKALAQSRKEYNKAEARIDELDMVFRKLYEDNALGKLSDQQFTLLTSGFEAERAELKIKLTELMYQINSATERGTDVDKFVEIVHRYTDVRN